MLFNKRHFMMPMLNADGGGAGGNGGEGGTGGEGGSGGTGGNPNQTQEIDYEKLAKIVAGKQSVAEDKVLKSYFQQQGLNQQEMEQAISAFKQQRDANKPDVAKLQSDAQAAQSLALSTQIENKALLMHSELGIDLKTIPHIMKLADLSAVVVDGKIDDEKLKEALNKVLEDVPQLKKQPEQNTQGFRQIGAAQQQQTGSAAGAENKPAVAQKKWNRWN